MRTRCVSLCFALFAAATFLAVAGDAAAAGLIPSAGEIVREGTLLDGPCSVTQPPAKDLRNWGPEKNGTPWIGVEVHTEFRKLDSHGQVKRDWVGTVMPVPVFGYEGTTPPGCIYDQDSLMHGIKVIDHGIWLMRVHHARINKVFEFTGGWVSAAGDGADAVTEIRFEVVGPNTCGNSAWVGLGPTDPACLRDNEKKQAANLAKQEQQDYPCGMPITGPCAALATYTGRWVTRAARRAPASAIS